MSCTGFWPRHSPYRNNLFSAPNITVVANIFNVHGYYEVLGQNSNLSPSRQLVEASGFFCYLGRLI